MEFTSIENEYVVLKLLLSDYRPTGSKLDDSYLLCGGEARDRIRDQERSLLVCYFDNWTIPFHGKLKGWRADSPTYVLHDERLVAGIYLCSENEFDEGERWGQFHYAFMDPAFKGRGIYSVLFNEAVDKARSWDLAGLILNSDRYLLPDVYIRWGAVPWKVISKSPRPGRVSLPARVARRVSALRHPN